MVRRSLKLIIFLLLLIVIMMLFLYNSDFLQKCSVYDYQWRKNQQITILIINGFSLNGFFMYNINNINHSTQNMKIYLIRHAQSAFNLGEQQIIKKYGPQQYLQTQQFNDHRYSKFQFDSPITPLGFNQCLKARQIMRQIDLDVVIVSPLYRTLQTAHEIFKDHKSKPKMIVDPLFREIFNAACNIGNRIDNLPKQFEEFFIWSQVKDRSMWYVNEIINEELKNKIIHKLQNIPQNERSEKAPFFMLELMKEMHKQNKWIDSQQDRKNRQKKQIQKVKTKYANQRVAIVFHNEMIKTYYSEPVVIENCSVREYIIQM